MSLVRLLGERLLPAARQAAIPTTEALSGASAVALYFSASWCPPCRGFTPQFTTAYNEALKAKGMRCVLVSSDHDEESFDTYFGKMPWLALPYEQRARKEALSAHFQVRTIPTLALVDPSARLLTTEARDAVVRDPQGLGYPWAEPAVRDLAEGEPGRVNSAPSVILLCEGSDAAEQQMAKEALEAVARDAPLPPERPQQHGEPGVEAFSFAPAGYALFVATGGPLAGKVRELVRLPAALPGSPPSLLLLDIPANGAFYAGPTGEEALTEVAVRKLLDDYAANRLERQQLS
uniref:Thioredoxin domain-containing protein n=1 Tax=Alexandrium monilatum TaxID=311494 RepID=A0A7S4R3S8_9DINO|mmetsp:Transcript_73524/g.227077  ORF Transcript_73524/g.227077 Transcript_73524/m.227077 type:complete len:291 (-) Transcript_73524:123-995(-)